MKTTLKNMTVETTEHRLMPYMLKGPRGSLYGLYRNINDPSKLYPITTKGKPTSVKGYSWFTDKNGIIEGLRN